MGYTEIIEGQYSPPSWMNLYNNIAHCKYCNAVYSTTAKFVKARDISTGTQTPRFESIRECKSGVCPCCEK